MLNLFYVHSGITAITAYDLVRQKIAMNEEVIIVTGRGQTWPFFNESLTIVDYDLLLKDKGEDLNLHKSSINTLPKQLRNWKVFLKNRDKAINEAIIQQRDFIAYLPIFMDSFICNDYCKGYYFLEEGQFAYLSKSYIKKITRKTFQARFKTVLFPILGQRYYPIDYQNKKFLGSVAITEEAFKWHRREHIISDINVYKNEVKMVMPEYDNIIVTGFLFQDINTIKKCFSAVISYIRKNNLGNIAIKLHPHVYIRYPQKAEEVENMLRNEFGGDFISFLPIDYIVENSIFRTRSNIFSLFYVSSVSLYATLFGSGSYIVHESAGKYLVECIVSVQTYLRFAEK